MDWTIKVSLILLGVALAVAFFLPNNAPLLVPVIIGLAALVVVVPALWATVERIIASIEAYNRHNPQRKAGSIISEMGVASGLIICTIEVQDGSSWAKILLVGISIVLGSLMISVFVDHLPGRHTFYFRHKAPIKL